MGLVLMAIPLPIVIGLVAGDDQPKPLTVGSSVPRGSSDAQFSVTEPGAAGCRNGDFLAGPKNSEDGSTNLCLRPLDS